MRRRGTQWAIGGAVLIAIALSACMTGHGRNTPIDKITVNVQSWGVVRERLSVVRQGADEFAGERNGQTFPITSADFERVRALLEPSERYAGRSLPCRRIMAADSQSGTIVWTRAGVENIASWTQACAPKRGDVTLANLAAARDAIREFQARSASAAPTGS